MNAITRLFGMGAGARRHRRAAWGSGSGGWGSRFAGPVARRRRTRRSGLFGSVLVAGAAYLFTRWRKARATGSPLATREAVPEL
jgi:hypothetical protein